MAALLFAIPMAAGVAIGYAAGGTTRNLVAMRPTVMTHDSSDNAALSTGPWHAGNLAQAIHALQIRAGGQSRRPGGTYLYMASASAGASSQSALAGGRA